MTSREEIAVVGYAARLPGAQRADAFWTLLRENRQSVSWITPDRFPLGALYHPSPDEPGRSYTFAAGVIDDVWGFDAAAFGISPREAEQVDPQQRHLLEVTHDALAHAGIRPSTLAGTGAGVYVGASSVDHIARLFTDPLACDMYLMTGNTLSIMANRISYSLDVHGPSLTVDTACSSSLVALNLAAEAIRSGKIDTAIVGGVNLLLSPYCFIGFSRASMLSPTGRCRPFDASADGYVRSEGAIVMVLRSMAAARKARNHVHAVIVGSGVGQDGKTTGLSLPSTDAQRQLLEKVYSDFAVDPGDLSFFEAHGTGTKVGDPLEANAIGKALAQRRSQPLPIGSVKSNIGHLEPASGLAGMLKTILALNNGIVPATLHQNSPNPNIPFDELNVRVIDRNMRLSDRRGPVLAGVNSFGFGGTNAHVIVASGDSAVGVAHPRHDVHVAPLLVSAHSPSALSDLAAAYHRDWPADRHVAEDFISAAAHLRDPLTHRALILGSTTDEIRRRTEQFAKGEASPAILSGQALGNDLQVAYLFSGNGSQWAGMGRDAWNSSLHFREALTDVASHFTRVQKWSIVDLLFSADLADRLRLATYSQPLLLALQVATVRILESYGVTPAATLGHSVGEIGAAWAAGALSLDQAIDIVSARSRHQEAAHATGTMAALMLSEQEARNFLEHAGAPDVAIAAINSPRSVTVSGSHAQIEQLLNAAARRRISARALDLDYPFHSALVDPVRGPLLRELEGLKPLEARRQLFSSVTGRAIASPALVADHWWHNVREPVRFEAALSQMVEAGLRVFVEIGPRAILGSYVRDVLRAAGVRGAILDTLREADKDIAGDCLEQAVCRIFLAGGHVEPQRFFGPPPVIGHSLPLYPWQHVQYKIRPTSEAFNVFGSAAHLFLGARPKADATEWYSTVGTALFPWILGHKVGGVAVLPATGFIEVMCAAAREVYPEGPLEVRDLDILRPLAFEDGMSLDTRLSYAPETGVVQYFSRPRGSAEWLLNARGIIGRCPAVQKEVEWPPEPQGTIVVPHDSVYAATRSLGFDYGPEFQRIKQASFLSSTCMTTALVMPQKTVLDGSLTDFTALDAALHGLFAMEEGGITYLAVTRAMPTRFARVRLLKPGVLATKSVTWTLRRSPTSMLLDIDLIDSTGAVVLSAEGARLVEAPAEVAVLPASISYRTTAWSADRTGVPSTVRSGVSQQTADCASDRLDSASLEEARLLIEAGCLRAAWSVLRNVPAIGLGRKADEDTGAAGDSTHNRWQDLLQSALLEHLERRGLADRQTGEWQMSPVCNLPELASIATSLLTRHPTMGIEAAALSYLETHLRQLVARDQGLDVLRASSQWRQLEDVSFQVRALQHSVLAEVESMLAQVNAGQLVSILAIGAAHTDAYMRLCARFQNLEMVVTDPSGERLDQARAQFGDDAPRLRFVGWNATEDVAARSIDVAIAIDALSEAAASGYDLATLAKLLRPKAPLVLGELAPSLFWDIVRGSRPAWWSRSAGSDFPISAQLTTQEWIDELQAFGFSPAAAGEENGVVLVKCLAPTESAHPEREAETDRAFAWKEAAPRGSGLPSRLASLLSGTIAARLPGASLRAEGAQNARGDTLSSATDMVWLIDAGAPLGAMTEYLVEELSRFADRCRVLAPPLVRLWILMDFPSAQVAPLHQPAWCALTSAIRVAQNEYSDIQFRCVGIAGELTRRLSDALVDELLSSAHEREVFLTDHRRTVFRAERSATPEPLPRPLDGGTVLRLADRRRTNRDTLSWVRDNRRSPGPDEIEIEVAASGLNFRDVMWNLRLLPEEALEDGYAGAGFGMECAGTVSGIGSDVEGLSVGDRVFALVPGAFASHVIAPAFAACKVPAHITLESAATIPVAFLTAYYSLVHLARLDRGETVLIHGGAGAVGLAALQIAKRVGARTICTAGSDPKRALLLDLGADFVSNSRSLTFADDVARFTGGRGVDVVLNSLAGDAMARSVDCLKPFGRFVELGKRDFYSNTLLGLRPFRRNLAYFGVDIDQLMKDHKELARSLYMDLSDLLERGELKPLPYRAFDAEQVSDAFRLMQHSGHIGKIVVTAPRKETSSALSSNTFPVSPEGTHVVVGGTGGFGLATAEWLADRGARSLVLVSRSGKVSDEAALKIEALRAAGVAVETDAVDVTDAEAVGRLLRRSAARGPIKGIVHAAMVLDDGLIDSTDKEAIDRVVRPKVQGALNLANGTRDLSLDYLLLFSSATTLFGNPGQYNYVGANAFLEGMARQLHADGRPALAVGWGAIEDVGYLARNIEGDAHLKKRFAANMIASRLALDGLDWAFDSEGKQLTAAYVVAKIDWAMARRELAATRGSLFLHVGAASVDRQAAGAAELIEELRNKSFDEAASLLEELVVEQIARVLRLPPKEIDRHRPLADIGMDSLMMLELRGTVEDALRIELPMMSLASGISPTDVARRIVPLVRNERPDAIAGVVAALSSSHIGSEALSESEARQRAAVGAIVERAKKLDGPL